MKIKTRHFIKGSEVKALKADILKHYDENFVNQVIPKKVKVELIQTEAGDLLYAVNNQLKLWKSREGYVPILTLLLSDIIQVNLKKVVVDMGAVKFVTLNKADIMRPGITEIDPTIEKDEIVQIVDETHGKVLAIGKTLFNAKEMQEKAKGKVIRNLHTIKDAVWDFAKEFK